MDECRKEIRELFEPQRDARFEEVNRDINPALKQILSDIEARCKRFKEDLIAMESRILDAFRQFITTVNIQDER